MQNSIQYKLKTRSNLWLWLARKLVKLSVRKEGPAKINPDHPHFVLSFKADHISLGQDLSSKSLQQL